MSTPFEMNEDESMTRFELAYLRELQVCVSPRTILAAPLACARPVCQIIINNISGSSLLIIIIIIIIVVIVVVIIIIIGIANVGRNTSSSSVVCPVWPLPLLPNV
jgi:hypothetical protein